jgi:RES domain-containing protein
MDVWRIAKERYALNRLGTGGSRTGGRWNSINVPVIYAGMSIEIASFEKLVHVEGELPNDLVLIKIEIPDALSVWDVSDEELPQSWDALPSSASAQAFGNKFVNDGIYLAVIVPSVIIPEARNIIINPNHEQWGRCSMTIKRNFIFDSRLGSSAAV